MNEYALLSVETTTLQPVYTDLQRVNSLFFLYSIMLVNCDYYNKIKITLP